MLRHLLVFTLFVAGAVAITWPLVLSLPTAVPDLGDPLLTAWIIDWGCHALTNAPLSLFDGPMYHPAKNMLAFSEHMVGIAVFALPFHLARLPPITVYNITLLFGFAFSGYGAFVLARMITRHDAGAVIGGAIFAFGSFKISHVQHQHIIWSAWLPLMLAALLAYWRTPDPRRALLLGAAFFMNGLTTIHWLLYGGFALVVTVAFLQFAEPRRERRFWIQLAAALGIASLLLLPFLIPYQVVSQQYGEGRTTAEARGGSALPIHWLVGSSRSVLYGGLLERWRAQERELFPGLLAVALTACAFLRPRRTPVSVPAPAARDTRVLDIAIGVLFLLTITVALAGRVTIGAISFAGADVPAVLTAVLLLVRFAPRLRSALQASRFSTEEVAAALWIVIGFLTSLGWYFFLHPFLFRVVTPFQATRTPARWAVIAYVGIAVVAAMGAATLATRRRAWGPVLLALAVVDLSARVHWRHVPPIAPVYAWIQSARPQAILELPMIAENIPFQYLHAQMSHRVPLVNGTSGFETPDHRELRELPYGDAFIEAAAEAGAELLIVHEAALSDEQRQQIAPMLLRLEAVHHSGTDLVFRIPFQPAGTSSAPRAALPR